MRATDILACLARRWPDSEYLLVPEAPEDASRGGRKIDLLVLSLWRSRGYERDAVEVKVSLGDWRRERDHAAKADFWWRHTHRFWLAVPAGLVEKVREELPPTWGLLSCEADRAPDVVAKAPRHDAEVLPYGTMLGVLRAAAGAGTNALHRAYEKGRQDGFAEGQKRAAAEGPDGALRRQFEQLRDTVAEFEQKSGIKISRWDAGPVAEAVNLIRQARSMGPSYTLEAVERAADRIITNIDHLRQAAQDAKALAAVVSKAAKPEAVQPADLFGDAA